MIELKNLTHKYQNQVVFENLNARFHSAEFISLLGPSGCGKSTLLRLLADLEKPSSGEIQISTELRQNKAMVFQEPELLPWRNTIQNILLPFELKDKVDEEKSAQTWLQLLNLQGSEQKYPRELSGGMKMRVALARALIEKPKLLLMDEPFSALDETTRESLQVLTRNIFQTQKPLIVFVTHSISEALFLSDRIFVMSKGGSWKKEITLQSSVPRDQKFLLSEEYFQWKSLWTPKIREVFE